LKNLDKLMINYQIKWLLFVLATLDQNNSLFVPNEINLSSNKRKRDSENKENGKRNKLYRYDNSLIFVGNEKIFVNEAVWSKLPFIR